jgi:hypothetical protein
MKCSGKRKRKGFTDKSFLSFSFFFFPFSDSKVKVMILDKPQSVKKWFLEKV